ncbi:hypothetical protein [Actinobaculum suis]|uniref:hypothetical protein n=1 Tax=Actinobaculum suis TaxID=1657 RepID=UPI0012E19E05|nr:hypothetical protein [Actinobaculum suis]
MANAAEVYAFLTRVQKHDGAPFRTSFEEVESFFDPARAYYAFGRRGPGGELVAFGLVRSFGVGSGRPSVILSGAVHPQAHNQLVAELASQQLWAARQLVAAGELGNFENQTAAKDSASPAAAVAVTHVEPWESERALELAALGFQHAYSYVQMRRYLHDELPPLRVPKGVELVELSPKYDALALATHNSFHTEKLDYTIMTPEQWAAERTYLARDWSFLALDTRGDRPRVLGYLIAAKYEQDWETLGWPEGYVDELAVHGGAEITSALLIASMTAQKAAGMRYTSMDVTVNRFPAGSRAADAGTCAADAGENNSGANNNDAAAKTGPEDTAERVARYKKLGFSPATETRVFLKQL